MKNSASAAASAASGSLALRTTRRTPSAPSPRAAVAQRPDGRRGEVDGAVEVGQDEEVVLRPVTLDQLHDLHGVTATALIHEVRCGGVEPAAPADRGGTRTVGGARIAGSRARVCRDAASRSPIERPVVGQDAEQLGVAERLAGGRAGAQTRPAAAPGSRRSRPAAIIRCTRTSTRSSRSARSRPRNTVS